MIDLKKFTEDMDAYTGGAFSRGKEGKKEYSFPKIYLNCLEGSFTGRMLPPDPKKNPIGFGVVPTIRLVIPGSNIGWRDWADPSVSPDPKNPDLTKKSDFFKAIAKAHYSHIRPLNCASEDLIEFVKGLRQRDKKYIPVLLYVKDVVRNSDGYIKQITPGKTPMGFVLEVSQKGLWDQILSEIKEYQEPADGSDPVDICSVETGLDFKLKRTGQGKDSIKQFLFIAKERKLSSEELALFEGDKYPNIVEMVKASWKPASELIQRVRDCKPLVKEFAAFGVDLMTNHPVYNEESVNLDSLPTPKGYPGDSHGEGSRSTHNDECPFELD